MVLVATATLATASAQTSGTFAIDPINDLALIYQGGTMRPDWTQSQFEPYVTHKFSNGKESWLFDGFLFLEFRRQGDVTYANGYGTGSTRTDWEWLMGRIFESGKALDALDKCITAAKNRLGDPGFKHKIVLMLPSPENGKTDWGSVNGKKLNFNKIDDKETAVEWYLQTIYDRFNKAGFKNLELSGFYWIEETTTQTGKELPTRVSKMVHQLGKRMYWIPFYGANNNDQGKSMGFDITYLQPNYFVYKGLTSQRLTDAVSKALKVGSALEMEFDESSYNNASEHDQALEHIEAYISAFERYGVWQKSSVAYYLGNYVWGTMANSSKSADRKVIEKLAQHIVDRHTTLQKSSATTTVQKAASTTTQKASSTTSNSSKSQSTTKKKWWELDWHF